MIHIGLIDHYDSFSDNVIAWLEEANLHRASVRVERIFFDDSTGVKYLTGKNIPTVLSPGPKDPHSALSTIEFVKQTLGKRPLLGICLGHQILGAVYHCKIKRAHQPRHGQAVSIQVTQGDEIFYEMPHQFLAASYNSLVVEPNAQIEVLAMSSVGDTSHKDELQAMKINIKDGMPAYGLQFHPESFLSECGALIRENWFKTFLQ